MALLQGDTVGVVVDVILGRRANRSAETRGQGLRVAVPIDLTVTALEDDQ